MKAVVPRALLAAGACSSCSGAQSALEPAGVAAERMAQLFWGMTLGGAVIWIAVVGLTLHAAYFRRKQHDTKTSGRLILGGGVLVPTVVLTALLVYGLAELPDFLAPAPAGSLRVHVRGEQWWWRVRYFPPNAPAFDLANELRLPVGETVEFELDSPDVIHSFWIPALGGKVDMIPGRKTRLALRPTKVAKLRGVCAEYCGTSHAWMAFPVLVLERDAFRRWREEQAAPARTSVDAVAHRGRERFQEHGCGACHSVRGTHARGVVGPDLTHVGSRLAIGAGLFARNADAFRRWLAHTDQVKPGVHMPAFAMLPGSDLHALAAYLESLK